MSKRFQGQPPTQFKRGLQLNRFGGSNPGMRFKRTVAERALTIFVSTTLDMADAWLVAKAQLGKVKTICSFDTDYAHISGIQWLNPSMSVPLQD